MNLAKIPRRVYLQGPTPIELLKKFSAALGGKINFLIKRDDFLPGCGGGNKTRKLDFSFAEAISQEDAAGAVSEPGCRRAELTGDDGHG